MVLAVGAAVTVGVAVLQGRPGARYGSGLPRMAPPDARLGIPGGTFTESRGWAVTVYSVRLRAGDEPDAEGLRAAAMAASYSQDVSWLAVSAGATAEKPFPATPWWHEWRAGFPMRALACSFTDDFEGHLEMAGGWAVGAGMAFGSPKVWIIPGRVLWPGFLVNTALTAGALLLLVDGPRAVVKRLRTPAGHCPRCRYDLSGLEDGARCPECGRGLAGR